MPGCAPSLQPNTPVACWCWTEMEAASHTPLHTVAHWEKMQENTRRRGDERIQPPGKHWRAPEVCGVGEVGVDFKPRGCVYQVDCRGCSFTFWLSGHLDWFELQSCWWIKPGGLYYASVREMRTEDHRHFEFLTPPKPFWIFFPHAWIKECRYLTNSSP